MNQTCFKKEQVLQFINFVIWVRIANAFRRCDHPFFHLSWWFFVFQVAYSMVKMPTFVFQVKEPFLNKSKHQKCLNLTLKWVFNNLTNSMLGKITTAALQTSSISSHLCTEYFKLMKSINFSTTNWTLSSHNAGVFALSSREASRNMLRHPFSSKKYFNSYKK